MAATAKVTPRQLAREGDQAIVARLSTVRGIGKWSAEMFLMFQLRRLDVWPTGDLAVRKGYGLGWDIPTRRRSSSTCWASPTTRTAAWWPGTAGARRSCTAGPGPAPSPRGRPPHASG